jgi:hypothetical protein
MYITVSSYLRKIQFSLFPGFAEELGPTTPCSQRNIYSGSKLSPNFYSHATLSEIWKGERIFTFLTHTTLRTLTSSAKKDKKTQESFS